MTKRCGAALTLVGLTNIVGTLGCGMQGDFLSKTRLLAVLYTVRALITLSFPVMPISPTTTLVFAAVMGLTWLGTVPLTSGVVAQMFGVTDIATLVGIGQRRNANGRMQRQRIREVAGIDDIVKLNRGLWTLAERTVEQRLMSQLKGQLKSLMGRHDVEHKVKTKALMDID